MSLKMESILILAGAGLAYANARKRHLRLKRERNACICPTEDRDRANDVEGEPPCWYSDEDDRRVSDATAIPFDDWCDTCKKRYALNAAFQKASRESSTALRRLARLAEKFGDSDIPLDKAI